VLVLALLAVGITLLARNENGSSTSGVQGSGVAATQTRHVASFSSVELAGSNEVTIRAGGTQAVVVHADDNLLHRVTTEVRSGTLAIGNTPGSFTTKSPMRVEVTVPSLQALTLSGSGVMVVSAVDTPQLKVTLSGSGLLRVDGTATRLDARLSGSGDAQLEQLVAGDVKAVVSGSGRIVVQATKSLDASVPGSGVVMYSGDPVDVTTSITGSGAVVRT
jgi:putative autotransporter adhesin-like protein